MNEIVIVGYSGHSYVSIEIIQKMKHRVLSYFDKEPKHNNPYSLKYLGKDDEYNSDKDYFIAIGSNKTRHKVQHKLIQQLGRKAIKIIDPSAIISSTALIGDGSMIAPGVIINAQAHIGDSCIINSGSIVEHECQIGDFVHLAPRAILCGNVKVGSGSFIGAGAVIKQGVKIGSNVCVGAGSIVINDIGDNEKVVGNPARKI